ncbi:D-alanine aminotransferase [Limihaloglobus sulfuriphilus]|uniref:branched-chain-amino-acid transaminase n=1 Tax=Limihaloglobus sulfuriphilus TaxID=1851148 RepID=A0A1Q2MGW4_9BACT|nr:aminotransferase class IV [Limihaloglobus sulfuriphilus]AQQ71945.1 D-alanine aminotransferase [Limihaloglobus sulfuriphilus]
MEFAYINDEFMPAEKVDPLLLDRGLFFGDGVYDFVRSYNGRIFALERHLDRFARSLEDIYITGIDLDKVKDDIIKAYKRAEIPDCGIYFHITRGRAPRSYLWDETELEPSFFLSLAPIEHYREIKAAGVKVISHKDLRWKCRYIKSLNLLPNVMAKHAASLKGCDDAVLYDKDVITEGASSTFFAIYDDTLVTHPQDENIIAGITRDFVISICDHAGLRLIERPIKTSEILDADEMFFAATSKDVLAIVEYNGNPISGGKPGPKTRRLEVLFSELTRHKDNLT